MSETLTTGDVTTDDATTGGVTAGALLRQAREEAGLHVATLAANLKVPVRKLEALEEDRYDLLPDAVFVRALASSVCRSLKVDPQPVLERLPQSSQPRLPQEGDGIGAPFRAPSDGPGPGMLDHVSKPVALTVLTLLVGALVLIFLPERRDAAPAEQAGRTDSVMPPPGASPQPEEVAAVPATEATNLAPATARPALRPRPCSRPRRPSRRQCPAPLQRPAAPWCSAPAAPPGSRSRTPAATRWCAACWAPARAWGPAAACPCR
jgi:cytoskeleton protein RodZ